MIVYVSIPSPAEFCVPAIERPFRCVILQERVVSADERWDISQKIVEAGCLYMMAWGQEGTLWDDSVDHASLARFLPATEVPDDALVMTTWHDKDTLEDLMFFAKYTAAQTYTDLPLRSLLILDLGPREREPELKRLFEVA